MSGKNPRRKTTALERSFRMSSAVDPLIHVKVTTRPDPREFHKTRRFSDLSAQPGMGPHGNFLEAFLAPKIVTDQQ